jgi:hypothetical protein
MIKKILVILLFPFLVSAQSAFISGNDTICDNGSVDAKVKVSFSGARNGITIIRSDKIETYAADLFPVGGSYTKISRELKRDFKSYSIDLNDNDWVYMYTDGYYDQIGEHEMQSLGVQKFEEIIERCSAYKGDKNQLLSEDFNNWKGKLPQIDDLLIIGFKV